MLKDNKNHAQVEIVLQNQCFVQMLLICGPLFVCNSCILGVRQSAWGTSVVSISLPKRNIAEFNIANIFESVITTIWVLLQSNKIIKEIYELVNEIING